MEGGNFCFCPKLGSLIDFGSTLGRLWVDFGSTLGRPERERERERERREKIRELKIKKQSPFCTIRDLKSRNRVLFVETDGRTDGRTVGCATADGSPRIATGLASPRMPGLLWSQNRVRASWSTTRLRRPARGSSSMFRSLAVMPPNKGSLFGAKAKVPPLHFVPCFGGKSLLKYKKYSVC